MTEPDPWAATTDSVPTTSNAVPTGPLAGQEDPFGTTSEYRSAGDWTPRVPFESIVGRLVIMLPKSFNAEARDPFNEGATREEYRVDLVVLDGGPLTYPHTEKDPSDATKRIWKDMIVPALVTENADGTTRPGWTAKSQSVAQGALIRSLKGVDKDGRFYLGVMARAPYAKHASKGATLESVKVEYEEWERRGKPGKAPESTWTLDDRPGVFTPAHRALAVAWWNEYRKTL